MSRVPEDASRAVLALLTVVLLAACGPAGDDPPGESASGEEPAAATYLRPDAGPGALTTGDTVPGHPSWTEQDWAVLEEVVTWARRRRVDTLPVGERVAAVGRRFVGAPYVPRTLDPPGPERVVVNLRAFDCVTLVENVLVMAHFVTHAPHDVLADRDAAMERYRALLASVRYRGGTLDGYPSRLHYFSEWLHDNAERGWIELVTDELGGVVDDEPIDFMTAHREAYDQLADDAFFDAVARVEERLSARPRLYLPQERVAEVADRIRTGDVIAATSTLEGLDVAHTGIAVRTADGVLRLLHAPLVGDSVEISARPLAERLLDLSRQDGIMVARPLLEPVDATGPTPAATESKDAN